MSEHTHLPCPCGDSSDAFSFNTDKGVGFCYSCESAYPKSGENYSQEVLEKYPLQNSSIDHTQPATEHFYDYRGVTAKTMEHYAVGADKENTRHVYKYPEGTKTRVFPKTFFATGMKSDTLFGMQLFPAGCSKKLTIVEGELDALSAYQMLYNPKFTNPVVSLPSASPSKKLWGNVKDYLNSFETIILCMDNDDAGNRVRDKINRMFPNKVVSMSLPDGLKDANDCLQANKVKEFVNSWWSASKIMPANVRGTLSDFTKLYDQESKDVFYKTGLAEFDDMAGGLAQGHYTLLKAPTGIGKTEILRFFEYQLLKQGVPFAANHLEERPLRSLLGLVTYEVGENVTRKELIEEKGLQGKVHEAIATIAGKELYYQYSLPEDCTADDLIENIKFMTEAFELKFVFLEPIQDAINAPSTGEKEGLLSDLAIRLSKVAAELNVGIVLVAHTNEDGDPKYCKMLGQRASVVVDISRNLDAEDEVERNTTHLHIQKNRPMSITGLAGSALFNLDTFTIEAF